MNTPSSKPACAARVVMLEPISALPAGAPMDDALFPLLWATG
jgi:hypothetical protein